MTKLRAWSFGDDHRGRASPPILRWELDKLNASETTAICKMSRRDGAPRDGVPRDDISARREARSFSLWTIDIPIERSSRGAREAAAALSIPSNLSRLTADDSRY